MRKVIFVMGASGVGKTELVRGLLGVGARTSGRWTIGSRCAAAGPYVGAVLDGPDQLPRTQNVVESMLDRMDSEVPAGLPILLDGNRFGGWAIERLRGKAAIAAILLTAPTHILLSRRTARGSHGLSAARLEGAARQCALTASMAGRMVRVDASQGKSAVLIAAQRVVFG
jgi:ribose 1,5-bisphosphokinase PhnN